MDSHRTDSFGEDEEQVGVGRERRDGGQNPLITTRVPLPDRRELGLPLREFKADAYRLTGIPLAACDKFFFETAPEVHSESLKTNFPREVFMALWNPQAQPETSGKPPIEKPPVEQPSVTPASSVPARKEYAAKDRRESVFGTGVSIDGKIEGDGDVRIAGKFKGEIQIKGDLTIEKGARIAAKINANTVTIGGEVEGNVLASSHVELLETAQLIGDLKGSSLTVAAGSRMRGHVEFGWNEPETAKFAVVKGPDKAKNSPAG
jgi:cytoskeletal protein CcmA (bactofilin family)